VLEDFLPSALAAAALKYFPPEGAACWKTPENAHTVGKSVLKGVKYEQFHPLARPVFEHLNAAPMLLRLADMFGIRGLLPDPYFTEGGFHRTGRGGFLDIHADFSHHDGTGLERRLNLILYLNEGWRELWGGKLELFDTDLRSVVSITPLYNRAVIFETSDTSYHGHPERLRCPEGVYRKSIALYYYTLPRPERKRRLAFFPTDPTFQYRG
jgi:hypothetical protein